MRIYPNLDEMSASERAGWYAEELRKADNEIATLRNKIEQLDKSQQSDRYERCDPAEI